MEPFFELTVKVIDQDLNPVNNTLVKIEVIDIENGNLIEGSIINLESTTDNQGASIFSFDNKAFITVRACHEAETYMCKEGHIYLEENLNKELTLMIEPENCSYCF